MIKAIIIDFYGVLRSDAYKTWLAVNHILREGDYFDISYLSDIGTITSEEFFDRLSTLTGRLVTPEELNATATIDTAVIDMVSKLSKAYPLALLSNAPATPIRALINDNCLEKYFDEIVISSEVGMVKPNRDIFDYTLQKLGSTNDETVFIDDSQQNVDAAEKFGIHGIHFVSANQLRHDLTELGINGL